jgi:O-antigen/teichoic acid export membrane protein
VDGVLVQGFNQLMYWVSWGLLLFSLCAFIDAAIRREDAYRAADKRTKLFWLIVLGVSVAVMAVLPILSILPIIGLVATIVYLVDVRPAIKQVTGGRPGGGRRGSSSDGPYGPFNR